MAIGFFGGNIFEFFRHFLNRKCCALLVISHQALTVVVRGYFKSPKKVRIFSIISLRHYPPPLSEEKTVKSAETHSNKFFLSLDHFQTPLDFINYLI